MKQVKGLLGLVLLGGLFTGCSSDNDYGTVDMDSRVPILLDSRVDMMTRSTSHDQDVQLVKGQNVSFFVRDADQWEMLYEDVKLTADGAGHFSYNTIYYPTQNDTLEFYGIHPYDPSLSSKMDSYKFGVQKDQSLFTNFLNSDLLYAKKEHLVKSNKAINMIFDHKLSKINFTIKKGEGLDLSKLSSIEIMGVKSEVTMDLSSGVIYGTNGQNGSIKAYGVKGLKGSDAEISDIAVILPPQDLYTGLKFIKLTADGKDYYYTLKNDLSFKSGSKYNFILSINGTGIEMETSITDWLPGDDIEGGITI